MLYQKFMDFEGKKIEEFFEELDMVQNIEMDLLGKKNMTSKERSNLEGYFIYMKSI